MNTAVRYAVYAALCFPLPAFAAGEVTERAVPSLPSPLQKQGPIPGTPMSATPMEQQLAALQQQVQALQAQLAMIQAAVVVTSNGVTLQGPTVKLWAQNNDVEVKAKANVTMKADRDLNFKAGNNASMDASSNVTIKSGAGTVVQAMAPLDLSGSLIRMNGGPNPGTKPLALVGSQVQVSGSTGQVVNGSQYIFGN
jgi:hypothetical protein